MGTRPDRYGGHRRRRRHIRRGVAPGRTGGPGRRRGLSPEDELAALRARVATLETQKAELVVEQAKLVTEREILRRAAKYFAGETNW